MSTPAAKRRRLDAANAVLRKPFQSPVIRRPNDGEQGTPGPSRTPDPNSTSNRSIDRAYSPNSPSVPKQPQTVGPLESPGTLPHSRSASSLRLFKTPSRPTAKRKPAADENDCVHADDDNPFFALVRSHRATGLDALLKDLDRQLDTARQARQIEAESEIARPGEPVDQEMRDLIVKWKGASRTAAEELFDMVKDRVASSGGPKEWREMQRRQLEFYRGFDQESPSKSRRAQEEDDGQGYERDDDDERPVQDEAARETGEEEEENNEPEFNMAQMLRSLNIDLSLLGYDEEEDKWID